MRRLAVLALLSVLAGTTHAARVGLLSAVTPNTGGEDATAAAASRALLRHRDSRDDSRDDARSSRRDSRDDDRRSARFEEADRRGIPGPEDLSTLLPPTENSLGNLESGISTLQQGVGGLQDGLGNLIGSLRQSGGAWSAGNIANAIQLGVNAGSQLLAPVVNGIASNVPILLPSLNGNCVNGSPILPFQGRNTVMCLVGRLDSLTGFAFDATGQLVGMANNLLNGQGGGDLLG